MDYFNNKKNVEDYIRMADGFDGAEIIKILHRYLRAGSSVLEIGMGPGKDLDILKETYTVTGSDLSPVFINMYLEKHPDADVVILDAISMYISRKFDCIYSNKVLHSITEKQFKTSLTNQIKLLNPGGILCHTLWYGDKVIDVHGMRFQYYTEKTILKHLPHDNELIYVENYKEMDDNDSLLIIVKKK